jgi:3(or 17)beta-hydroxysteroid dehydrogenase
MRLQGKVAVITGGASGMGAATARRFRREGAAVVVTDVQAGPGQALAEEIGALFIAHDVADPAAWNRIGATVEEKFGRLDVMMNNAGITGSGPIETISLESWNRIVAINLTGVMLGCQLAVGLMRKNPAGSSGSIINISSTAGLAGMASDVGYTATKGGVRLLTKSVAMYCAKEGTNIRCNSIHPGAIDTPMLQPAIEAIPGMLDHMRNLSPFGRMGAGDDIAAMCVFLASDESAFVTGAEMLVDGGMMAGLPGF